MGLAQPWLFAYAGEVCEKGLSEESRIFSCGCRSKQTVAASDCVVLVSIPAAFSFHEHRAWLHKGTPGMMYDLMSQAVNCTQLVHSQRFPFCARSPFALTTLGERIAGLHALFPI